MQSVEENGCVAVAVVVEVLLRFMWMLVGVHSSHKVGAKKCEQCLAWWLGQASKRDAETAVSFLMAKRHLFLRD